MSTRIVIFTIGTQGDIRPHVALGHGLAECGHRVTIATDPDFAPLVRAHGLGFSPLTADFFDLMRRHRHLVGMSGQAAMMRALLAALRRWSPGWAAEGLAAAGGAGLIIGAGNASFLAASLAERLRVPFVLSQLQPFEPNRALPPPLLKPLPVALPGAANLALHKLLRTVVWRMVRQPTDDLRQALGLAAYPRSGPWALADAAGGRTLYGFSGHVVPRPPDWPERIALPGFFVLRQADGYVPPAALRDFLAAGPAPIYVGFGSMVSSQVARLGRIVWEAVRLSGCRAVVSAGWAGLAADLARRPPPAGILVVDAVPHDWLFPQMLLAVHHCGAGTMAAAVEAGIPTVPVPFLGDQFFWGWQLRRLGVATRSRVRRRLSAQRLADAIRRACLPGMRRRAAALGALVRAEDGVAAAIRQLDAWEVLRPEGAAPVQPLDLAPA